MKFKKLATMLCLSIATSTTFGLSSQEINQLIHKQKISTHQSLHANSSHSALTWKNLSGPHTGGRLTIISGKQNPLLVFTFHGYGIYKSIDGGQNWVTLSIPKNKTIHDIALIDDNHLLLAADNHVYTSSDQGEHWTLSATKDVIINHFFVLNANLILMETNQRLVAYNEGIYRSTDGGKTWEPARLGLNAESGFWGMGGRDNLLFLGAHGLYVSSNGGKLWTQPSDRWKFLAQSIAVNSHHDIFVTTAYNIYKTDISGQAVVDVTNGITGTIRNIKVDKNDYLYVVVDDYKKVQCDLYQSVDNGKNWQRLYSYSQINSFNILDNGNIVMNTNEGLVQTDTHQQNVNKLPFPFSLSENRRIFALDEKHYFSLDNALSRSDDAGQTWTVSRNAGPHIIDAATFNQQILFLQWDENGNDQHVFRSLDQGKTWQNIYDNIYSVNHSSCDKLSSQNHALIIPCKKFALFTHDLTNWEMINKSGGSYYFDGKSLYYANGSSIQVSQDEGKTWSTLLDKLNAYHIILTGYGNVVLAAIPEAGIVKITHDAKDWDLLNTGINDFHFSDIIAIDEMHYIASTHDGVYYTSNGGKNWQEENNGLNNLDITNMFASKEFIFLGSKGNGIFYSRLDLS